MCVCGADSPVGDMGQCGVCVCGADSPVGDMGQCGVWG